MIRKVSWKSLVVISFMVLVMIILAVIISVKTKEIKGYQHYISSHLITNISELVTRVSNSDLSLNEAITNRSLSVYEANFLSSNLLEISHEVNALNKLAQDIKNEDPNYLISSAAVEHHMFINKQIIHQPIYELNLLQNDAILELKDKDIEELKLIQKDISSWKEVIYKALGISAAPLPEQYIQEHSRDFITKKDWFNLYTELQNYTS
ncbi:hypothetical protein E6C60_3637 [Paenibacillus algicola]|uniref:Chemotaxis methyl-accepting receptor HlyB-like 4HB MCP domain-containing protein n=1 Tax=Paenibacillus algicola TaxID=2565926 RepID=A0A4P8XN96_9BACL|nr:hypothetical protein [Paenibacillus algicola]QCT04347.1 hypothetical protein E6C60_3637 [Paenibacillus algicola]